MTRAAPFYSDPRPGRLPGPLPAVSRGRRLAA